MRNLFVALLAVVFVLACKPSAPGEGPKPDPVAVASASASLACTVVVLQRPEVVPQLVEAIDKSLVVLDSEDPKLAAISAVLAEIENPQSKAYAVTVINLALVLFPAVPSIEDLPPQYVTAVKAALNSCRAVIAPAATTTSTTVESTSTTVETTSTTEPEPTTTSTSEPETSTTSTTVL